MQKVFIVGCGAYMDAGYGCPGEWRCLKAAALGEGKFGAPVQVMGFIRCECPGRTIAPTVGMTARLAEVKPDAIYFSTCLVDARPGCPYGSAEDLAKILETRAGVPVILGTHEYKG
jgi:predicted metal-binding protein